jgi:RIO kinase 1
MRERIPRRRARFDDENDTVYVPVPALHEDPDLPPSGDRWSTWTGAQHGPEPRPGWVVTAHGAVDTELGVLKSGKEADVHLIDRAGVVMAAKRYRAHKAFHRDAAYQEGRRVRRSRETRAMANRTAFGRDLLAGQWALAEFTALGTLWSAGLPVPYPVQLDGTELLLEFVGHGEEAAPRLAQLRPSGAELADLWAQLGEVLHGLARLGWAHGDLSAYNLLVHEGRLVMIDLPQVVDLVGNPHGAEFLVRDVRRIAEWFASRGLDTDAGEPLFHSLVAEAGLD